MDDEQFERFMKHVEITDECWNWTGFKDRGYGKFYLHQKDYRAHRLMYIHCYGTIDDNLVVRHKCRGKCVNPEHLELGTHQDNSNDMLRDETCGKLTKQQVIEIRASNEHAVKLAIRYKVNRTHIYDIKRGKYWKN